MKSRVTKYEDLCFFCGNPAQHTHHLIFGTSERKLADADGLFVPVCAKCHNSAEYITEQIHENPMAEKLSKMLGQAIFERNYFKYLWRPLSRDDYADIDEAREFFINRYGRSYL